MELSKRSIKKIESIIAGAQKEFIKYGFNKTTMDGIAATSGVSKVTVYKYFEDKQAIYEHILKEIYLNEVNRIEEIINTELDFSTKVDQVVNIRLEKYRKDDILTVEQNYIRSKSLNAFIEERVAIMDKLNHKLYEQGKVEGLIIPDLTDEVLNEYFRVIRSGLIVHFDRLKTVGDENLNQLFELLYAGVLGCDFRKRKQKGND